MDLMIKAFRSYPPLEEDFNKSIIRVEANQMLQLGINPGDVVKVTGVRSTGAICMPIENGYRQPSDSRITYLPETGIMPQARISNIVALNTNNEGALMVEMDKVAQSTIAQKVTLTTWDANCIGKSLDEERFAGLVLCKGDRIVFNDDKETVPSCLYWVTDVYPNDFSIIGKGTRIELSTRPPTRDELKALNYIADLTQLKAVIPVARQLKTGNVDITIPSIEIYDDGARFYLYLRGTYGRGQGLAGSNILLELAAKDDIGNFYAARTNGGSASVSAYSFSCDYTCMVAPKIDPNAKELTILLKEILFHASLCPPFQASESESVMMLSEGNKYPDMFVLSGPWEFKVRLQ